MLALATGLVAWAAFQNNEWTRDRFALSDEATSLSQSAEDIRGAADANEERDRQLFIAWMDARTTGAVVRQRSLESLFREEFRQIFRDWLATDPLRSDGKLASAPFDNAGYDVSVGRAKAAELAAESRRQTQRSEEAARRSSEYSFLTVVFAGSLMFIGLGNLFNRRAIRWTVLGLSIALLLAGAAWLATLPVEIAL